MEFEEIWDCKDIKSFLKIINKFPQAAKEWKPNIQFATHIALYRIIKKAHDFGFINGLIEDKGDYLVVDWLEITHKGKHHLVQVKSKIKSNFDWSTKKATIISIVCAIILFLVGLLFSFLN